MILNKIQNFRPLRCGRIHAFISFPVPSQFVTKFVIQLNTFTCRQMFSSFCESTAIWFTIAKKFQSYQVSAAMLQSDPLSNWTKAPIKGWRGGKKKKTRLINIQLWVGTSIQCGHQSKTTRLLTITLTDIFNFICMKEAISSMNL